MNLKDIHRVAENAKKLNFDMVVRDSIEQTKSTIVSLNRQNLLQGLKVDASRIGTYASIPYAAKKVAEGSVAGFGYVNLYLTGDWSKGIKVVVNDKSFTSLSDDIKSPKLELDYGNTILGLPDSKKPNYVEVLAPVILEKTKTALFGL